MDEQLSARFHSQFTFSLDKMSDRCQKFGMQRKRSTAKLNKNAPEAVSGPELDLSRRERQIMDALYRFGKATAFEIRDALPDPPSYTAVRTLLTILEERGHVKHASDGTRYVYEPMVAREEMAKTAVDRVLRTFFDNSVEQIVATLLNQKERKISDHELERLARMIKRTREEGR